MKIGTAQIDITPSPGIELCGFANREQPSDRVLDSLYAKVLFLEYYNYKFILISLDLIGVESSFVKTIRKKIHKLNDIPLIHIQVFATHTHSGPGTIHLNFCGEYNPEYVRALERWIIRAVDMAGKNIEECLMGFAEDELRLGRNRRNGEVKPLPLKALFWKTVKGNFKALLVNYPMHPVCLKGKGISADYPGVAGNLLYEDLPGNPVVLFGLGAAGDLDPPVVGASYDDMINWGAKLRSGIKKLALDKNLKYQDKLNISIKQKGVKVELEQMSTEGIDRYAGRYLIDNRWEAEFGGSYKPAVEKWKMEMTDLVNKGKGREKRMEISLLEIGVLKLIFVSAELFSEFEKIIERSTTSTLMVISCANGMEGYFPDRAEYDKGGYEIETSIFFYNSFLPVKGLLEDIAEAVSGMLK